MAVAALLLIALRATPIPALADNPYAVAGISNPALVRQFIVRLPRAVADDDRAAVAAMVNYAITTKPPRGAAPTYPNAAAKPNDLFDRDLGVMIRNGEI